MKRCEEMERKLRYLQREAMRDDIAIDELSKIEFLFIYILCNMIRIQLESLESLLVHLLRYGNKSCNNFQQARRTPIPLPPRRVK